MAKRTKKRTRRPEPLTLGNVGIPKPSQHSLDEVPLRSRAARWEYVSWHQVYDALSAHQSASIHCPVDEVKDARLSLHAFMDEQECPISFDTHYDDVVERLWFF